MLNTPLKAPRRPSDGLTGVNPAGTTPREVEAVKSDPAGRERACEYCGNQLERLSLPYAGRVIDFGWRDCDCDGARQERARNKLQAARRETETKANRYAARLERAGIPPRYHEATHPLAGQLASELTDGRGLYLYGPNGTGKTTLAAAIARLKLNERPLMVGAIQLLLDLQATYGQARAEAEVLAKYGAAPLLIVDDLGKEQATEWAASRLYAIVDARYGRLLPTIVTSNFQLADLAARFKDQATGQAIVSRLTETSQQLELDGPDLRGGSAK